MHTLDSHWSERHKMLYLPFVFAISKKSVTLWPWTPVLLWSLPTYWKQSLVQVKNCIPPKKKDHMVYEFPCRLQHVHIEELGRTLEWWSNKPIVGTCDQIDDIAVHAWSEDCSGLGGSQGVRAELWPHKKYYKSFGKIGFDRIDIGRIYFGVIVFGRFGFGLVLF